MLAWLIAIGCAAWAFGALQFDFPVGKAVTAWGFAAVVVAMIVFLRGSAKKLGAVFLAFIAVLAWWLTQKPSNDGNWQPDVAQVAWADINGDEFTFHNVRNCDYRTDTDYTPRWETRTVRLSQITGIDLAIDYWGSPWIAHPIVSFQFADAPPLCFSIETRKTVGQSYSTIGGLYRQFALIYLVADERDVIRLRTNYRNEDIYRWFRRPERASVSVNMCIPSMHCVPNRAGITPSRPTAPRASAHSIPAKKEYRGTGGFYSTAKPTNCCMNTEPY